MTDSVVMDSEHVIQKHCDGGELFSSARKSDSISSSSSSLRSSFDAEYFQVDENKHNIIPIPAELASKEEEAKEAYPNAGELCPISMRSEQTAIGAPPVCGESDSGSPDSEVPIGEKFDSEHSDPGTPLSEVLQSPGVQMMERQPDDYRIPPCVFDRNKSSSPGEWSMTSNESLFSIHVGINSFSKEQFFMMYKSGELSNPHSPVAVMGTGKKSFDLEGVEEAAAAETMKEVLREAAENQNKAKAQPAEETLNNSSSRCSDVSGTSNKSFAFPILTEDTVKKGASVKVEPEQQTPKDQAHSQSTRVCPTTCGTTNWFSWVPPRCRFCC